MILPYSHIINFAKTKPEEFKRACHEFFPSEEIAQNADDELIGLFFEWLIYEFKQKSNITFFVEYVLRNPDLMSGKDIKKFRQVGETQWYSDFQLVSVVQGSYIHVEDVFTGKKYDIFDEKGSQNCESKGILKARVAYVDGKYYFVGANPIFIPVVYTERMKKILRDLKKDKLSARDTALLLIDHDQNPPDTPHAVGRKEILKKRNTLKDQYKLYAIQYKATMKFSELLNRVLNENGKDVGKFWEELMTVGIPKNMLMQETQFFQDVWNFFPHKSLRNLSPVEMLTKLKKR